jgi:Cys-rich four helix bundle protein (predicted Tat secretion target)
MNRRDLLIAGAAFTLAAQRATAGAETTDQGAHAGHNMAAMSKHHLLVMAASECANTAQVCLNHCLMMFAEGDTELAKCAQTVNEVQAACRVLVDLGNIDSSHLPAFAKAAIQDCKTECDRHAAKHEVCKACADACEKCAEECDLIAA